MSDLLFDEPETDETVTIPHDAAASEIMEPALTTRFVGYGDIEAQLVGAINAGRMPHAIILAGDGGRGKETFAYRLARALLSTRKTWPAQDLAVEIHDPVISKLARAAHPDCAFVKRQNKKTKDELSSEIVIDTVRSAAGFMGLKPVESAWRVVIVNEAHLMNEEAQNAFLKTLEEPPAFTVLILIADQVARLLPTIRSRAQLFHFSPLPPSVLMEEGGATLRRLPVATQDVILRLARGGIGALHALLRPAVIEGIDKIETLLVDRTDLFGFSESWPGTRLDGNRDPMALLEDVLVDHMQTGLRMELGNAQDSWLDRLESLQALFQTARTRYLEKRQVIRRAFALIG